MMRREVKQIVPPARATIKDRLREMAEESLDFLTERLRDNSVAMNQRIQIAQDFMDRSPDTNRKSEHDHMHKHIAFTPEQLAQAQNAAREIEQRTLALLPAPPKDAA